jgi:hypothetical protein
LFSSKTWVVVDLVVYVNIAQKFFGFLDGIGFVGRRAAGVGVILKSWAAGQQLGRVQQPLGWRGQIFGGSLLSEFKLGEKLAFDGIWVKQGAGCRQIARIRGQVPWGVKSFDVVMPRDAKGFFICVTLNFWRHNSI